MRGDDRDADCTRGGSAVWSRIFGQLRGRHVSHLPMRPESRRLSWDRIEIDVLPYPWKLAIRQPKLQEVQQV